jgi:CRP-like cAMP-binding protein
MDGGLNPGAALNEVIARLGGQQADSRLRHAAWVARCVGRGEGAPLRPDDLTALADVLESKRVQGGAVVFRADQRQAGVWIVREGRVELSVGSGPRRAVVHVLRPGDVDGDIELLLDMPMPYTGRALTAATCLHLSNAAFDRLIRNNPTIARRWLSSVAVRLATSQTRILGLLGHSLTEQVVRLLLDEASDGVVDLTQRTMAAMLGARRPSLNKILKDLEADGLISTGYGSITVLDERRLAKRAGN